VRKTEVGDYPTWKKIGKIKGGFPGVEKLKKP